MLMEETQCLDAFREDHEAVFLSLPVKWNSPWLWSI
jgi:hypothetical protein